MQPQLPQIEKIATALGIGTNALLDIDSFHLKCNSIGDFMGILILLNHSKMIQINGEYDEDNKIKPDTLSIQFTKNPLLDATLEIKVTIEGKSFTVPSESLSIEISHMETRSKIVSWECMLRLYEEALQRQDMNLHGEDKANNYKIIDLKEKLELEMQHSLFTFVTSDNAKKSK